MTEKKAERPEEHRERIKKFVQKYAQLAGLKVNPANHIAEIVIEGLTENLKKHGKQYCPCRIVSGDPVEDRKIICPCVWHKDEIELQGHCHCNLYVKG